MSSINVVNSVQAVNGAALPPSLQPRGWSFWPFAYVEMRDQWARLQEGLFFCSDIWKIEGIELEKKYKETRLRHLIEKTL